MTPILRLSTVLLFSATLISCSSPSGPVCTAHLAPGIVVTVENGITGDTVTGALAVAKDGSFVDSTRSDVAGVAGLAHERPGTYEVTVQKDGFSTWTKSSVQVEDRECHVKTVRLNAVLDSV